MNYFLQTCASPTFPESGDLSTADLRRWIPRIYQQSASVLICGAPTASGSISVSGTPKADASNAYTMLRCGIVVDPHAEGLPGYWGIRVAYKNSTTHDTFTTLGDLRGDTWNTPSYGNKVIQSLYAQIKLPAAWLTDTSGKVWVIPIPTPDFQWVNIYAKVSNGVVAFYSFINSPDYTPLPTGRDRKSVV